MKLRRFLINHVVWTILFTGWFYILSETGFQPFQFGYGRIGDSLLLGFLWDMAIMALAFVLALVLLRYNRWRTSHWRALDLSSDDIEEWSE